MSSNGEITEINFMDSTLMYRLERVSKKEKQKSKFDDNQGQTANSDQVFWRKNFNKGMCNFADSHEGMLNGSMVKKHDICRVCWSLKKEKRKYKEGMQNALMGQKNDLVNPS